MRKIHLSLALLLTFMALPVAAADNKATPPDLQTLEELPPPEFSNEDNADEPQITIIKKGEETIEEYRIGGQLYMMKITPAHGVPYYLHKEDQDGAWINNGPVPPMSIPKWTIFRF
jgi:hypothetical protein